MSERRKTISIDAITVQSREPVHFFADVLNCEAGAAIGNEEKASSLAESSISVVGQGDRAFVNGGQVAFNDYATLSEVESIVASSDTAADAVRLLASQAVLEVSTNQAPNVKTTLRTMVSKNDKAGIGKLAAHLVRERQNRLQGQLVSLIDESCKAAGFVSSTENAAQGLVMAARLGTTEKLIIDIAKSKEGRLMLNFDAHGFSGGACTRAIDAVQTELHKRGVFLNVYERKPKPMVPVKNVCQRIHARG